MTSLSQIHSCQIVSVEEHDTRYGTFLLNSITLSGFVQSSLMMQRQNLRGRKGIRTVFLVVNFCSLKVNLGGGGDVVAWYVSSERYARLNRSYKGAP